MDDDGVEGKDPTLVEGVFKGEEGGEELSWADGASGTGASCVGRDVSDTGDGGEEVAEGPVKDKEAVFEVEEFLEGEVGSEEVGSLACFIEASVFRFELTESSCWEDGLEGEAEVGDPGVFDVIRDLVA